MTRPKTTLLTRPVGHVAEVEEPAGEAVVEARRLDLEEREPRIRGAEERERVGVERHREERHDDGDEARQDEEREGVDGERAEGVDLLGDDHRPELRGVVGADAPRDHQRREQRSDLADRREAGAPPEQALGAVALDDRGRLDDGDDAGEERGDDDDRAAT